MKQSQLFRHPCNASIAILLVSLLVPAHGAIFWNETSQSDLSNLPSAPSAFTLSPGVNSLVGTARPGDNQDWLRFTIAAGLQLTGVTPISYVSSDPTAFTGVQNGTTFVGSTTDPESYLGYTHLSVGVLGINVLGNMGAAAGAQGFTPPLPAGDYVFLIQQLGGATSYQVDYTLTAIPEPRAQAAAALLLCAFFLYRCRRNVAKLRLS